MGQQLALMLGRIDCGVGQEGGLGQVAHLPSSAGQVEHATAMWPLPLCLLLLVELAPSTHVDCTGGLKVLHSY